MARDEDLTFVLGYRPATAPGGFAVLGRAMLHVDEHRWTDPEAERLVDAVEAAAAGHPTAGARRRAWRG